MRLPGERTPSCPCSVNANNDGTPSNPGASYQDPHVSHTLQMAPLLPQGVHWLDEAFYASQGIQNGVFFPGRRLAGSGLLGELPCLPCSGDFEGIGTDLHVGALGLAAAACKRLNEIDAVVLLGGPGWIEGGLGPMQARTGLQASV